MIITDKGHFWLTFDNGYTISVFNGYGSYSDNHYNNEYILYPTNDKETRKYINQRVESTNCEIAILNSNGALISDDILHCDDIVKGYVNVSELLEIINIVSKLDGDK